MRYVQNTLTLIQNLYDQPAPTTTNMCVSVVTIKNDPIHIYVFESST